MSGEEGVVLFLRYPFRVCVCTVNANINTTLNFVEYINVLGVNVTASWSVGEGGYHPVRILFAGGHTSNRVVQTTSKPITTYSLLTVQPAGQSTPNFQPPTHDHRTAVRMGDDESFWKEGGVGGGGGDGDKETLRPGGGSTLTSAFLTVNNFHAYGGRGMKRVNGGRSGPQASGSMLSASKLCPLGCMGVRPGKGIGLVGIFGFRNPVFAVGSENLQGLRWGCVSTVTGPAHRGEAILSGFFPTGTEKSGRWSMIAAVSVRTQTSREVPEVEGGY
ncbi:hypothetical protein BXZ70DRAFT_908812 [Cristinia sonorae]|uniref:Uncharacterized protein n=1 Tax=Cristinia sonorae TaxID=1940300 RepID=A0A8K0UJN7_9AGAR|nr:hypothetical protein BXZ70DRAFT_908812 [Cristinia sonorae]